MKSKYHAQKCVLDGITFDSRKEARKYADLNVLEKAKIIKDLKPCPFCGNKEIEFSLIHPQYVGKPDMDYWVCWGIGCPECGATMEYGRTGDETWDDTQEAIITAWNRREGR